MTKLFQLVSGGHATEYLEASGQPGLILTESPELIDRTDVCQLVEKECTHYIAMGNDLPPETIEVAYGDCRFPVKDKLFLSCDIMDYDFWHYHEICARYGRFCFSVDSDQCDKDIYLKTIEFLKNSGEFCSHWRMLES